MPAPSRVEDLFRAAEERIFAAIRSRDVASLSAELAADFVHSSPGGPDQDRAAFLRAVGEATYRILEIRGESLAVRDFGEVAALSGIQRAWVALADGSEVSAATAFVDIFVLESGAWRLRQAVSVELPSGPAA